MLCYSCIKGLRQLCALISNCFLNEFKRKQGEEDEMEKATIFLFFHFLFPVHVKCQEKRDNLVGDAKLHWISIRIRKNLSSDDQSTFLEYRIRMEANPFIIDFYLFTYIHVYPVNKIVKDITTKKKITSKMW